MELFSVTSGFLKTHSWVNRTQWPHWQEGHVWSSKALLPSQPGSAGAGERRVKQASVKTIAPYILYRTGQHQRLPRHLLAQQIRRAAFIFNCLGSKTSRCHKERHCCSKGQEQDGIIPFNLSAFTLSLNELIRRYAGPEPVCLLCVAAPTHLPLPLQPHQACSISLRVCFPCFFFFSWTRKSWRRSPSWRGCAMRRSRLERMWLLVRRPPRQSPARRAAGPRGKADGGQGRTHNRILRENPNRTRGSSRSRKADSAQLG